MRRFRIDLPLEQRPPVSDDDARIAKRMNHSASSRRRFIDRDIHGAINRFTDRDPHRNRRDGERQASQIARGVHHLRDGQHACRSTDDGTIPRGVLAIDPVDRRLRPRAVLCSKVPAPARYFQLGTRERYEAAGGFAASRVADDQSIAARDGSPEVAERPRGVVTGPLAGASDRRKCNREDENRRRFDSSRDFRVRGEPPRRPRACCVP
jgi:hypothetical protein